MGPCAWNHRPRTKDTNNYLFKTLISSTSERSPAAPDLIGNREASPTISGRPRNLISWSDISQEATDFFETSCFVEIAFAILERRLCRLLSPPCNENLQYRRFEMRRDPPMFWWTNLMPSDYPILRQMSLHPSDNNGQRMGQF